MTHTTLVDQEFLENVAAYGGDGTCHRRGCGQPLTIGQRVYWPIWYDEVFHTENEPHCRTTDPPVRARRRRCAWRGRLGSRII